MTTTNDHEHLHASNPDWEVYRKLLPTLDTIISDALLEFLYEMQKTRDCELLGDSDWWRPALWLFLNLQIELQERLHDICRLLAGKNPLYMPFCWPRRVMCPLARLPPS